LNAADDYDAGVDLGRPRKWPLRWFTIDKKERPRQLTNTCGRENISDYAFGSALAATFFAGTVVIAGRSAVGH
jgi:hypothetical protein